MSQTVQCLKLRRLWDIFEPGMLPGMMMTTVWVTTKLTIPIMDPESWVKFDMSMYWKIFVRVLWPVCNYIPRIYEHCQYLKKNLDLWIFWNVWNMLKSHVNLSTVHNCRHTPCLFSQCKHTRRTESHDEKHVIFQSLRRHRKFTFRSNTQKSARSWWREMIRKLALSPGRFLVISSALFDAICSILDICN